MIILISDLDLHGSGYLNIAIALCDELARPKDKGGHGRNLTVLGIGYDSGEHSWPFRIIPVAQGGAWQSINAMVNNFDNLGQAGKCEAIEAVVVALDIPHHEQGLSVVHGRWPYVGIFPIESGPLRRSWAAVVQKMQSRLVISEFGRRAVSDAGLSCEHLVVGLDARAWKRPTDAERAKLRGAMNFDASVFHVLTVADNQERKNLSAAAQAISILAERGVNVKWSIVTRIGAYVGWNLDDLAADFGITDRLLKYERGLAFDRMWVLHATADAFLLTSKAEGCCLPVLEAMSTGLPVAATDCTAVHEHLFGDGKRATRGFPIKSMFKHIDPWGNSIRHYADPVHAADQLERIWRMRGKAKLEGIITAAQTYAQARTWTAAGDLLDSEITRVLTERNAGPNVEREGAHPVTIPRAIPPEESAPSEPPVPMQLAPQEVTDEPPQ